jgi:predicted enzyme related to lactoylglutathione lyase
MSAGTNTILHTVIIKTTKMTEMAEFYRRGLELSEAVPTGSNHLGFEMSNIYFGFDLVEEASDPTGSVSLWFEVDDIEATFNRFEQLGARIGYPPSQKPWGAYLAALYDLDGNTFGLAQRKKDS